MAFKMTGWSAFTKQTDDKKIKDLLGSVNISPEERERLRALKIEEAKKKMSKWELADYEKIQREKYHSTGVPRYLPRNKKWERQPDGKLKMVSKTRGGGLIEKLSKTKKIKDPSRRPKKHFKKPYWLGTTTWP